MKLIIQAMHEVMAEVKGVQKTGYNAHHRYKFTSESDVLETVRPIVIKNGLLFIPTAIATISDEEAGKQIRRCLEITYTILHVSGEQISMKIRAEGMDSQDKASSKAMTIALKFAYIQAFNLPRGEDPDRYTPERPRFDAMADPRLSAVMPADDVKKLCAYHSWPGPSTWTEEKMLSFIGAVQRGEIDTGMDQFSGGIQ